jgi:hypothetical protein
MAFSFDIEDLVNGLLLEKTHLALNLSARKPVTSMQRRPALKAPKIQP